MVIGLAAQLSALAETVELTNRALIAKNLLKEAELERLAELDEVKAALKKSRQSIVDAMQLSMRS